MASAESPLYLVVRRSGADHVVLHITDAFRHYELMQDQGASAGVKLSAEQEMVARTCRRIVDGANVSPPPFGRSLPVDDVAWAVLRDRGLATLRLGVAHGGGGGSTMDVCVVAEELARGPLPVPFLGTLLGLELLELAGCRGVIEAVLDAATNSVGLIVASDLCSLAGNGVAFDATAGKMAVGVQAGNVVLCPVGEVMEGLDLSRGVATTGMGDAHLLGPLSPQAATHFEAFALAVLSAELVGAAEAALERAVAHVSTRKQFGRAVGAFQAVQHLCADALVLVESSRSIMWYAAWAVDAHEPDVALVAARTAKAYCAESALTVVEMAVQAFGGIGMTWEAGLHLLQRRVLFSRALLGNEYQHLEVLADLVTGGPHGVS